MFEYFIGACIRRVGLFYCSSLAHAQYHVNPSLPCCLCPDAQAAQGTRCTSSQSSCAAVRCTCSSHCRVVNASLTSALPARRRAFGRAAGAGIVQRRRRARHLQTGAPPPRGSMLIWRRAHRAIPTPTDPVWRAVPALQGHHAPRPEGTDDLSCLQLGWLCGAPN